MVAHTFGQHADVCDNRNHGEPLFNAIAGIISIRAWKYGQIMLGVQEPEEINVQKIAAVLPADLAAFKIR